MPETTPQPPQTQEKKTNTGTTIALIVIILLVISYFWGNEITSYVFLIGVIVCLVVLLKG